MKAGDVASVTTALNSDPAWKKQYWDEYLPSVVATAMLPAIGELFDLSITPQQFVTQMDGVIAAQHQ